MKNTGTLPRVVIVGAGFGGLRAARALAKSPVQVTLVDRNNYHLFQPLLYQVATASLSPDEIAQPVRAILGRQRNLEFRMAEVRGIDLDARVLDTSQGPIPYDMPDPGCRRYDQYLRVGVGCAQRPGDERRGGRAKPSAITSCA